MFGELSQSCLDSLRYRLGIPRPGHPIGVKTDDEDAGYSCGVHTWTVLAERPDDQEVTLTQS